VRQNGQGQLEIAARAGSSGGNSSTRASPDRGLRTHDAAPLGLISAR
jgi:hypothetical protein